MTDHFYDELEYASDNGLRAIINAPGGWTAEQVKAAQDLLNRRETFERECARINRLGSTT